MPFTNMIGNGGLLSTVADLLKWNANLDHPVVGGPSYVETMQTRMRLTSGNHITYALGLIVSEYDGVREVSHSGSTAGYQTYLARYPDQHVSVAVWCNTTTANPTQLAHEVVDLVLAKPTRAAQQAGAPFVHRTAAEMARWSGTYVNTHSDAALRVTSTDSSLVVAGAGFRTPVTLRPISAAEYRGGNVAASFETRNSHRTLAVVNAAGDTTIAIDVPPVPATTPVDDYVGRYTSQELDAQFTVVTRGGKLYLKRRPADEFELRPVYADDFSSGGGLGTLRFHRDGSGRVTGFSFYAGRVLDVRFEKR